MLQRLLSIDAHRLTVARPPEKRLVGVCHHFTKFFVAMLRAKEIPARARWGFGSYFNPGFFEDHTLVEYWNAAESRWVRAAAQLDALWRDNMKLDFNVLDVPHDRFLIAADAWTQCRASKADASKFGIFQGNLPCRVPVRRSETSNLHSSTISLTSHARPMPRSQSCASCTKAMTGCACLRLFSMRCSAVRKRSS